jgi:hypothetical protein
MKTPQQVEDSGAPGWGVFEELEAFLSTQAKF